MNEINTRMFELIAVNTAIYRNDVHEDREKFVKYTQNAIDLLNTMLVQMGIIGCLRCGRDRQLVARSLCASCYSGARARGELEKYKKPTG